MRGPGRYGARAEHLLKEDGATIVVIISVGGPLGSAFDVATIDPTELATLPGILRRCAAQIEREVVPVKQ